MISNPIISTSDVDFVNSWKGIICEYANGNHSCLNDCYFEEKRASSIPCFSTEFGHLLQCF